MMEPTAEVKKLILEQKLQIIVNTIYSVTVDARVAKSLEDKQSEENHKKSLVNLEKSKDFIEAEIKALEPQPKAE